MVSSLRAGLCRVWRKGTRLGWVLPTRHRPVLWIPPASQGLGGIVASWVLYRGLSKGLP